MPTDPTTPAGPTDPATPPTSAITPQTAGEMCPRLPSSDSAHRLTQGELSALPYVLRDVVGRAILIGGGIYLLGDVKGFKNIAKNSLAGAAFIETFVLLWIWKQTRAHNGNV